MTNIVLNNITSGYNIAKVNDNFSKIRDKLNDDTLNLAGGNNVLSQDVDLNSHNLLNVGRIDANVIELNGSPIFPTSELTTIPDGVINVPQLDPSLYNSLVLKAPLAASTGTGLVGYQAAEAGSVLRTLKTKLQETLSVKDFGATGDGVTDDTNSILTAINAGLNSKKSVYFPAGTYIVDTINIPMSTYAPRCILYGAGKKSTFIKKKSGNTNPIFTFGSPTNVVFASTVLVRDISFDGNGVSVGIIKAYDLVRSNFSDCTFTNGSTGVDLKGGIIVSFDRCLFDTHTFYGVAIGGFASLAGGGAPNGITFNECIFGSCGQNAIFYDDGRKLTVRGCDIEACGGPTSTTNGGIYIGPNVGAEVGGVVSVGLRCYDTWFERNLGRGDIVCDSANNYISDCYFVAGSSVINNVTINGGKYTLANCVFDTLKTVNIMEGAGVSFYNYITNCPNTNKTINLTKTLLDFGFVEGGNRSQGGVATVGSSGVLDITFPFPFRSPPHVSATVQNNSSTSVISAEVYAITSTGFTVHTKSISGSPLVIANASAGVQWTAVQ